MTEPLGAAGETGERTVWETAKRAFAERGRLGYWRYPIFSSTGTARKEPDILIADPELGLVVIEVKSLRIDQINGISGHRWTLRNAHSDLASPYQQAENQLWALLGYCEQEPLLRRKVTGRVLVALPWVESGEWLERGFHTLPSCPPILFGDNLGRAALLNTVKNAPPVTVGEALSDEAFGTLKGVLAGTSVYRQAEQDEPAVQGRALVLYDPANSRLKVLYAWGAKGQPGFYSELTLAHGVPTIPL